MKTLEQTIKEALTPYIGSENNIDAREQIKQSILSLKDNKVVKEVSKVNCEVLWKLMTFKQKLLWFMLNWFPFKNEGTRIRSLFSQANNYLANNEQELLKLPCYLESNPKEMFVVDYVFTPMMPLSYTTFNITVK